MNKLHRLKITLKIKLQRPKNKLQHFRKRRAIDKALDKLVERAFWPKSVMENYFQKEVLPRAGDAALKEYMIVKGVRILPKVAHHGAAVFDFLAGMLDTVKKDPSLKAVFMTEGVQVLPALVKADNTAAENLVKGLLQVAGDDKGSKGKVFDAVIDVLPLAAKHSGIVDNRLLPFLVKELRQAAGDDLKQPVVYKELAVSPASPVSGRQAFIIAAAHAGKEPRVVVGCFAGLAREFKKAVDKKYPDPATPGRIHYNEIMDLTARIAETMAPQASLHAAVKAKLTGATPIAGAAWPIKKAPPTTPKPSPVSGPAG